MLENKPFTALSVIIPTYNREKVLEKALNGYLKQSSVGLIHELIVVDDGSTDDTESMVRSVGHASPFPVRYLRQPNQGPAAARNVGIRQARSALILFTDSDIVPGQDLVEKHVAIHCGNPAATVGVLGYVTWPPEIHATPFMRWYGEHILFEFHRLRNKQEASFRFFYTCNVSLKTEFLRSCGGFDEDFKTAAYEDSEFGYRLHKNGLHLLYSRGAWAYHYQSFSFEEACQKSLGNASAAQTFYGKEAGRQVLKQIQDKRARYKLARRLAAALARVLHFDQRLLNSTIPLPGWVYRFFLWARTTQTSR